MNNPYCYQHTAEKEEDDPNWEGKKKGNIVGGKQ